MSTNFFELPKDLPRPIDDGAANHLRGMSLPTSALPATNGAIVDLAAIPGRFVIYIYPMTGRPGVPLPDGWDGIPGARGCTPQSCSFRDHFAELNALNTSVFGLSTQSTEYQKEARDRLHLPFELLSDSGLSLKKLLRLPTFTVAGMELYKRITLIIENGGIQKVFYPVFPPDQNAEDVLAWLRQNANRALQGTRQERRAPELNVNPPGTSWIGVYNSPPKGAFNMSLTIRPAVTADIEICGRIIYQAFKDIADRHRFPPDFPTVQDGIQLATSFINHPSIFGVVADYHGQLAGSNFLDERDPIRGLGPITVDPNVQQRGVGRRLMEAVLERGRGAAGIRLLQDSFNVLSVSLYTSLGFDVKEPLLLMRGKPKSKPPSGVEVRPLKDEDLSECAVLCKKLHGFDRVNELRDALQLFSPYVAMREGRLVAYASAPTFWPLNHGVAETEEDMKALLLGAGAVNEEPLSFLLPVRQANFFRWCLSEGLRVIKPMTLMVMGDYQEPNGCYFVSVLY